LGLLKLFYCRLFKNPALSQSITPKERTATPNPNRDTSKDAFTAGMQAAINMTIPNPVARPPTEHNKNVFTFATSSSADYITKKGGVKA
jgi:hypothetical protein